MLSASAWVTRPDWTMLLTCCFIMGLAKSCWPFCRLRSPVLLAFWRATAFCPGTAASFCWRWLAKSACWFWMPRMVSSLLRARMVLAASMGMRRPGVLVKFWPLNVAVEGRLSKRESPAVAFWMACHCSGLRPLVRRGLPAMRVRWSDGMTVAPLCPLCPLCPMPATRLVAAMVLEMSELGVVTPGGAPSGTRFIAAKSLGDGPGCPVSGEPTPLQVAGL